MFCSSTKRLSRSVGILPHPIITGEHIIVIKTKYGVKNIGGHMVFGSIAGSDSYYIGPPSTTGPRDYPESRTKTAGKKSRRMP